jgi:hypothetical protein
MKQSFVNKAAALALAVSTASAAVAADQTVAAARKKFFGIENVDKRGELPKDKVVFSWLGHMSGAVSLGGHVIMLDSYIARLEVTPGRTPIALKDLVDLKPEALFISHGHGDHADNAVFIAAKTGATLYMTPEACGTAQTALTRMKNDPFMKADPFFAIPASATISCIPITTAGSVPGTEVIRIKQFEPNVCINAFRALHSHPVAVDSDWGLNQVVDTPDPRDPTLFPPGVPLAPGNPRQPGQQDTRQGNGPGGVDQLDYQFVMRGGSNFSMLWNSSVGAMKEGIGSNWTKGTPADGQRLLNLVRSLPNTDLNFATVSSKNTDQNGWRDHVYWAQAVQPKIMTTGHVPVGAAMQYYSGFMKQLKLMEHPKNAWPGFPQANWPIVRNHTDPTDILKPEVYELNDPAWESPAKHAKMNEFCHP